MRRLTSSLRYARRLRHAWLTAVAPPVSRRAHAFARASGLCPCHADAAAPLQIFSKRPREDWRRMLAVSAEWPKLGPRVFVRIEKQAAAAAGEQELALLVRARGCAHVPARAADALWPAETAAHAWRGGL